MSNIHERAKVCFESTGTITPILETINTRFDMNDLKSSVKGKHGSFFSTARSEINMFGTEFRQRIRFRDKVDIIDDLIHVPHLHRNGDISKAKFHYLSRAIATGGVRELPIAWTGLVSLNAAENAEQRLEHNFSNGINLSRRTYLDGGLNSKEHFYNNLYAASVILCYKLYFDSNRETLEDMCNVFRQVHITTAKENSLLAHNGQNEEDGIGWREAYRRNDIVLVDAQVVPVKVLRIRDVVPDKLIEMTMDMRVGWRN